MSDQSIELYKQHRTAQEKYTYFLLAAAGAAIAFAVNKTQDVGLEITQVPLAFAVVLWALSFYFGCKQVERVTSILYTNMELLKVQSGLNTMAGTHPEKIAIGVAVLREILERDIRRASLHGRGQFTAFIGGTVAFIVWHVIDMFARTS